MKSIAVTATQTLVTLATVSCDKQFGASGEVVRMRIGPLSTILDADEAEAWGDALKAAACEARSNVLAKAPLEPIPGCRCQCGAA